ncbi:hypothetical protein ACFY4C_36380 [Actinomadura viridis]|uniref:phosphorylase family protein n=1 Tax=Actinomadura viridis TaxID=58110 RepID=UPI00367EDB37
MTRLVVCAALAIEAWAVASRAGPGRGFAVVRTGPGPARARAALGRLPAFDALAVAGYGGSLVRGPRPGDVFVATEVRAAGTGVPCRGADTLADLLREAGLRVLRGPLVTTGHVVTGAERGRLAASGALAVDMESRPLAEAARTRPFAVVRAIVDTPDRPLARPATLTGGLRATRALRSCGPALRRWTERLDKDRRKEVGP